MKEFKKTVDRHRHRVYTFAFYSLGNREEAEDVTQEVLIRLWQNWNTLNQESLTAWLNRFEGTSAEPSPEAYTESNEMKLHIRHALAEINEPYRSIMILREIQQLKYEEIADTVDLPLNTVKSYLYRGRRMLRDRLKETISNERA
jgi:RNA polymerase sigma-70 factor (ECF subfamily)